ncbi:hypothetical protein L6452_00951 [Arctium lappa]|uniref:Uncharacterized protein n=1 Tax=Arctium lappa TaxID=4217 RepID=A0ACB9FFJ3_ARCLA|nr:hypothetical protein L6452_00951 [Arctium lappa]
MKDLAMDDKEVDNKQDKVKLPEDSDFKKEPVIEIVSSSRCTRSTTISKENKNEIPKKDTQEDKVLLSETKSKMKSEGYMDLKMKHLMNAKEEAKNWLETANSRFPRDESFNKYKTDLDNLFRTTRWTSMHSHDSAANEEKGKSNSMGIVMFEQVDTAEAFDACWECPNFVAAVYEKLEIEVHKS